MLLLVLLTILAALDSNLVVNLGLRKYSPSFICTSQGRSQDFSKGGAEVMEAKAL